MDRLLISLKFTLLRNSSKGLRVLGLIAGVILLLGTWAAVLGADGTEVRGDVLALAFAGWVIGSGIGPVLMSGSGVLRPDYFALLPIDGRQLSRGLLITVFVSNASGIVLLAFLASAIHAVLLDPFTLMLVVVGAPLSWIFAVTLSRLIYGLLGAAMRSRIGVEIAGIQFGLMFAALFTGWIVVQAVIQTVPGLLRQRPARRADHRCARRVPELVAGARCGTRERRGLGRRAVAARRPCGSRRDRDPRYDRAAYASSRRVVQAQSRAAPLRGAG